MKLHNTLGGQLTTITPGNGNTVSLYTCGLTVYSQPHIGNWVAYIYWDILVRTLLAEGYTVNRVQNITDVGHLTDDGDAGEDKMQKGALREGKTAWDVAEKYIQIAEHEAFEQLGLLRPNHMPRATDFIPQQIAFVEVLKQKGFVYQIADGLYFDTAKLSDYGKLAQLDIQGLAFGARVADTGKKNPTDFAVWKFSPPNEKRDMEWDSPWGKGFPGWHLECSVMARELLGDKIDIHTGGIDHIPVHHTNEIAQTEAVTGQPFAHTWVHANHIKVDGAKMSKSLGNIYTLQDIIDRGFDVEAFKIVVLSKHYRTEGNFTWDIVEAAQNRLDHWRSVAALRWQTSQSTALVAGDTVDQQTAIDAALQNDLDTPLALKLIDATMSAFEQAAALPGEEVVNDFLTFINSRLGIDLITSTPDVSDEQRRLLEQRSQARQQSDWTISDRMRDELLESGITVRDTADGQRWSHTASL